MTRREGESSHRAGDVLAEIIDAARRRAEHRDPISGAPMPRVLISDEAHPVPLDPAQCMLGVGHDVDRNVVPFTCLRCARSICAGCGRAFDLMCNYCDEGVP